MSEYSQIDYEVVSFEEIWSILTVDEQLEDAFAQMTSAYSRIGTAKEAYIKLTAGHSRNIRKWHLTGSKAGQAPQGLELINQRAQATVDVEDGLLEHWHGLQRCLEDVNQCSRNYIMDFSIQLNNLGDQLQRQVQLYKQREDEILIQAENTLEAAFSDKFKAYRLRKLKQLRKHIQEHHESETNQKVQAFQDEIERRRAEQKAMDQLKTEVSQLKIEYSAQPLIRQKKLAKLNDQLLAKQQELTLLKVKLERMASFTQKEKLKKQQNQVEQKELEDLASKSAKEKLEQDLRLKKRGHLIYKNEIKKRIQKASSVQGTT
uniref:Uncharacterized protein n=1 Tax=Ditylenchus dipsaci TaxID=166011 RepID=A0A915E5N7_9BILA